MEGRRKLQRLRIYHKEFKANLDRASQTKGFGRVGLKGVGLRTSHAPYHLRRGWVNDFQECLYDGRSSEDL